MTEFLQPHVSPLECLVQKAINSVPREQPPVIVLVRPEWRLCLGPAEGATQKKSNFVTDINPFLSPFASNTVGIVGTVLQGYNNS